MIRDPNGSTSEQDERLVPRVFLREPGWNVALKVGSEREFCHSIAPGDDAYHRLADGEIYVYSTEEKLCFPCADRRGLLHNTPKGLRESNLNIEFDESAEPGSTFKRVDPDTEPESF